MTTLTRVLTIVLFVASGYMFYRLYGGIQSTIDTRKEIETKEAAIIEQLKIIRQAEMLFQGVYGRYTPSWDTLAQFVQTGAIPIIERREIITQKAYGGEDVTVRIDTLGFVSAKSQVFERKFTMSVNADGVFTGFKVKVGDKVIKNQRAYSVRIDGKDNQPPFSENGVITSLANVSVGDSVRKGDVLISFSQNAFDPNTNLSRLGYKPGTDVHFDIFVGKVDKTGVDVDVIEVKDPQPDDPSRNENNDSVTRKPLRFGSQIEASTAGNWE